MNMNFNREPKDEGRATYNLLKQLTDQDENTGSDLTRLIHQIITKPRRRALYLL